MWRRRRLGVTAWIVVACAVVQLFVVITTYRGPAGQTTPLEAVAVLATRLFVEPLLGYRVTWILSGAGIPLIAGATFVVVVLGLLVIASSVIPRRTLAVLVYAAVVVAVAGVLRSADSAESLLAGVGSGDATSCSAPRRSSPSSSPR